MGVELPTSTRTIRKHAGGTRFIGLYLARQLVEEGHEVTLYTRGKKAVSSLIPDDTPESYKTFSQSIQHISGDRMVGACMVCMRVHAIRRSMCAHGMQADWCYMGTLLSTHHTMTHAAYTE